MKFKLRHISSDDMKSLYARLEAMGDKVDSIVSINSMGVAWFIHYLEKPEEIEQENQNELKKSEVKTTSKKGK